MNVARTAAEVLAEHTTLELECVDRMYLNVYVPALQTGAGAAHFFKRVRGNPVPSSALMAPMTRRFVAAIERFATREGVDLVRFERHERKDDRTRAYLREFSGTEGVLYVGKAQEKARVLRTERREHPVFGPYPWLVSSTAMVNHYYVYIVDEDFGPLFVKFCSYFPHNAKLCVNGHEYLKRQLAKRGVAFEALDNGILSCADPALMRRLADNLTAARIDALLRKWLARLPHPFTAADRAAGIRYDISVLQAEFALTQVFDRPVQGRVLFEEVMRENLDLGRPDHVQLIFDRRVTRRTPSRYRTRVITDGVVPSLHVDYKHSRIKQYHKEGRALRTETVINDTYDFDIGRRLRNLEDLKKIGFAANRRLLRAQRVSHDCLVGAEAFDDLHRPRAVGRQRASALRFGDPRAQALLAALLGFRMLPDGFQNRDLRARVAPLMGLSVEAYGRNRMTYDLRRLRLRGLIEKIPLTRRYRVTDDGLRTALCYHRTCARVLRPAMSAVFDAPPRASSRINRAVDSFDREIQRLWEGHILAA
ncbi:MAG: hypothetical protein OXF96_08775 [Chloroflexi bacterium]|nr:hypothetical protein [Chloroflexota bacterium]